MKPREQKYSVGALIVCGSDILLKKTRLKDSGQEILDIFGAFMSEGDNAKECIERRLSSLNLPSDIKINDFGSVLDHIHKRAKDVDLYISFFRVKVDDAFKNRISKNKDCLWLNRNAAISDLRTKRTSKFINGAFGDEPFNHVLEENQFSTWADAKTLRWHKK